LWPAAMQIYWNKKKYLHNKRVQFPQDLVLRSVIDISLGFCNPICFSVLNLDSHTVNEGKPLPRPYVPLMKINKTTAHGLVARAITSLKHSSSDEGGQKPLILRTEK